MSSASNADITARCSAGISASLMGLNPLSIAPAGSCQLITRSPRRPIRSGVRRWQSRSVLVAGCRTPPLRRLLLRWPHRLQRGAAANRGRQPRSSSHAAARSEQRRPSGSGLYPAFPLYHTPRGCTGIRRQGGKWRRLEQGQRVRRTPLRPPLAVSASGARDGPQQSLQCCDESDRWFGCHLVMSHSRWQPGSSAGVSPRVSSA
jgi:hypothetical protein